MRREMIKYSNRVPFLGLYCRKKYGTAAKKRHYLWKTFGFCGAGGACPPRRSVKSFALAGGECSPPPPAPPPLLRSLLPLLARVGRRLRLFAVLKLSATRPDCAPPAPQKRDFPPAGGCASVASFAP